MNRPSLDGSTLLRVALLLLVVILVLWAVQLALQLTFWFVFEVLPILLAVAVVGLVVLWLLDRL
ncbi:MAG: DUF7554 family protein [Halobacteriota archaeon]